jgi:peptidoglycan/LPS O-acetylase OafA/YrhL
VSETYVRNWPARYELLDGLRGIACIGVLLHHLGIAPIGHYAVMVFFLISGYCITASAQSCLRRGVSFRDYLLRRARRIYPPYLLALAFFAATRYAKAYFFSEPAWHPSAIEWLQNLTLTQWGSDLFHHVAWPADNKTLFVAAFWSLDYEEQFYLVIGICLLLAAWRGIPVLRSVLFLACVGLAWNMMVPGGWVSGIFIEYWPHFALGSVLYFVLCEEPRSAPRLAFVIAACALGTFCAMHLWPWPDSPGTETARRSYLELLVLSAASLGLLASRPLSEGIARSTLWRPVAAIGTISYSLYLIHQFNLTLIHATAAFLLPRYVPTVALDAAQIVLHLCLATVFWYLCERPFLNRPVPVRVPASVGLTASRGLAEK